MPDTEREIAVGKLSCKYTKQIWQLSKLCKDGRPVVDANPTTLDPRPSVKDKNPDEIGAFDGRLGRLVDVRVKAVNYCAITYTGSRLEPDMVCTGGIEKNTGQRYVRGIHCVETYEEFLQNDMAGVRRVEKSNECVL